MGATIEDIATIVASIPGATVSDWTEKFPVELRGWLLPESQMFIRYDKVNKVFEWSGIVYYNQENWTQEMLDELSKQKISNWIYR